MKETRFVFSSAKFFRIGGKMEPVAGKTYIITHKKAMFLGMERRRSGSCLSEGRYVVKDSTEYSFRVMGNR